MALPNTFANETTPTMDQLDENYAAVGAIGVVPCVVTGTNTLTFTPGANTPTISAYANYMQVSGIVAVNNSSTVTARIGTLPFLNVYKDTASGPIALASGDLLSGNAVVLVYDSALNGGAGGFHATNLPTTAVSTTPGVHRQVFTTSGTFTTPVGTNTSTRYSWIITGGGGGANRSGSTATSNCGGGGAGATALYIGTGIAAGGTVAVTVGTGGAATANGNDSKIIFNATTVTGGGGVAANGSGVFGAGGTATNGDVNIPGGNGINGGGASSAPSDLGIALGGVGYWGGKGGGTTAPYGAGGWCGVTTSGPGLPQAGTDGIVIVEWIQ